MSILIKKVDDLDKKEYLSFCENNLNCWIHHKGIVFLEDKRSLSFVLIEEGRIIALCPMVVETKVDKGISFNIGSLFGLSLPCPVVSDAIQGTKHLRKIKKMVYDNIQEQAEHENIAKMSFNFSSYYYAGKPFDLVYDELTNHGFLNTSLKMMLLNLRASEEECWKSLSKGHRSILKKFICIAEYEYINRNNSSWGFNRFSEIMLTIAGFSESELKYLYMLYQEGHVEICHLIYQNDIVGSALFLKYGNTVQYHAAQRFTDENIPVHHLIIWEATKKFRHEGYGLMDLGVFSHYPQLNYVISEKSKAVNIFKQGFGGRIVPFMIGERYFDSNCFAQEYSHRISRYKETIQR